MKVSPFVVAAFAAAFLLSPLRAIEPDEVRVRVSVKRVLSSSGALPTGTYGSSTEITRVLGKCNDALRRSGAAWTLVLSEIVNTQAASPYYTFSASQMGSLEQDARANKTGYAWRDDAINMYVVDEITDAGGVCSFPGFGPSREVITINSRGILGGSEGWLHEIGHYFNLIHTHEGDQVADTITDPPIPNPFNCAVHDSNFEDAATQASASELDTFNGLHNIMSYHCDPQVLTPLQVVRMRRALLDFRAAVVEPQTDQPPTATLELPLEAAGGVLVFDGSPVAIELSGSSSTDGDGGGVENLTCRWSIVAGPAGGARIDSSATGWLRGCTGIGYGDDDDLTELTDMQNRYITVHATRTFEVTALATIAALELDIAYDDGFAAYLNGTEVARRNLAPNADVSTPAERSLDAREVIDLTPFLPALVTGANRLSIEVHNAELDSSDLSMHAILRSRRTSGAVTTLIASRAVWYYQKGSAGAPPADWKEPAFDAASSRAQVTFTRAGVYRVRLTVDDGLPPASTDTAEVEVVVGGDVFVRGDCNGDGSVDIADAVSNLIELFAGGPTVPCQDACDSDDDEARGLTDAIFLLRFLFTAGQDLPPPFPTAGTDPVGEALGCRG